MQLRQYLDTAEPTPLLLDVREPWEFDKARIDGAVLVPMRSVPERMAELDPERCPERPQAGASHGRESRGFGHPP